MAPERQSLKGWDEPVAVFVADGDTASLESPSGV